MRSGSPFSLASKSGFSLLELLLVIAILVILVSLATQAVFLSKSDSDSTRVRATLRTLNETATRLRLKGDVGNPGTTGSDAQAALQYYVTTGYLRSGAVSLEGVDFVSGFWEADP